MRKLLLTSVASCALVAVVPATAQARHASIQREQFGSGPGGGGWALGRWLHQALTPVATVTSFTNNVLTITDNSGNAATGQLTNNTRLICILVAQPTSTAPASTAPTSTTTAVGISRFEGRHGFGDPGFGHGRKQATQSCTPATALMAGAGVVNAELSIGSAGSEWERVVVEISATQPTSTAPTSTAPTSTAPASAAPTSTAQTSTGHGKKLGHSK
jgi:hypothetical protein